MIYDLKLLGNLIKDVREAAGMTATTVRAMAGDIDSSSYSRIENPTDGFSPRADKLSAVLGVVANLNPVLEHQFDFSGYLSRPCGQETVNYFLAHTRLNDRYTEYQKYGGNEAFNIIEANYTNLEQPIRDMLENYFVCRNEEEELKRLIHTYKMNTCKSKDEEMYFPYREKISSGMPQWEVEQMHEVDEVYQKMLMEPTMNNVKEFVEAFIRYRS